MQATEEFKEMFRDALTDCDLDIEIDGQLMEISIRLNGEALLTANVYLPAPSDLPS